MEDMGWRSEEEAPSLLRVWDLIIVAGDGFLAFLEHDCALLFPPLRLLLKTHVKACHPSTTCSPLQ